MKNRNISLILYPLIIFALLSVSFCKKESVSPKETAFYSGGIKRSFGYHLPTGYDTEKAYPVIFAFHGSGSDGYSFMAYTNLNSEGDNLGFIIVYPDAVDENWAEGNGGQADRQGIDDVQFVRDILDYLENEKNIKLGKIFAVGFSQGGFFAHRLGLDLRERITSYATVASSMSYKIYNRYRTSNNLPVIMFHGTGDLLFLWEGDNSAGVLSYLPQDMVVQTIVNNNNCNPEPVQTEISIKNSNVSLLKNQYKNQSGKILVEFYRLENIGHEWHIASGISIENLILSFFKRFL